MTKLEHEIRKIDKKYPLINYGACGVFSYYLSMVLDRHGINNNIVYIEEKNVNPLAFRCDIKFDHIMVDIGDYVVDNNGFHKKSNKLLFLDKDKLFYMINEPRLWSDKFNWNLKDSLIQDILNIKLF